MTTEAMTEQKTLSLTITREFDAPVAAVFRAWTDPELMRQWWAPGPMRVANARSVARVGDGFRVEMRSPEDEAFIVTGTYKKAVDNERLVFSWSWEHSEIETEVRVDFAALESNRTRITITHSGFHEVENRDKHNEGWEGCLAKLAGLFSS